MRLISSNSISTLKYTRKSWFSSRRNSQKFISKCTNSGEKDVYQGLADTELYALFDTLLGKHPIQYRVGDKVFGTAVSSDKKNIYVDVGLKDLAILPIKETKLSPENSKYFVGESLELMVLETSRRNIQTILSLNALEIDTNWERAHQQLLTDFILDVRVIEAIKGGYRVDTGGLQSFLPISQIHPEYLVQELIGKTIPVKLIDVMKNKNRCVCSNRKAILEDKDILSTLAELKVGNVVSGYVQNITPFGAFIDLNGIAGLLHISQISNDRIGTTEGVFQIGEPIKCMVLAVDTQRKRLSLTTKKLEPSPGDMLRNRSLVMEKAEEMAQLFRSRVEAAEAAVKASEDQYL